MNQQQLIDRLSRLQRKLSASQEAWHSGRIDCPRTLAKSPWRGTSRRSARRSSKLQLATSAQAAARASASYIRPR